MTKSFDEWFKEKHLSLSIHANAGFQKDLEVKNIAKSAFKAGQQSKQDEIDELKREIINKTNEAYADGQKSMRKMIKSNEDELQKRIDGALEKCYTGIRKQGGDYYLELVQDILKGACNEEE